MMRDQYHDMETWIPDSAVKVLVDDISEIIKHKRRHHHLIAADVMKALEELKAQLKKLRMQIPDYMKVSCSRTARHYYYQEMMEAIQLCEDAVDHVHKHSSGGRRRSTLPDGQMLLADTKSRKSEISKARNQIQEASHRVKRINEKFSREITTGLDRRLSAPSSSNIVKLDPAQNFTKAQKFGEERVIGFDKEAIKVVGLLTTGADDLKYISIVGGVGMGKTTLAKLVYSDDEVQSQYKIRVFIYLSTDFDIKQVLVKILSSITKVNDGVIDQMDTSVIIKHIRKQLEGKQYLVVLDNVSWTFDVYVMKDVFPDNRGKRCRVLITTRFKRVVEEESRYMMNFLSHESSLELFRWNVFGNENYCPVELQKYESVIVKNCNGLPSSLLCAAIMITKHLDEVKWWRTVADTLSDNIPSYAREIAKPAYVQLPNHLKPCFLYLAAFGRDSEIPVWKLLRLWISEGFILEQDDDLLEDYAEQYLEQLVDQKFVVASKRKSNGRIGKCRLTSVFWLLCDMAGEDENFLMKHMDTRETSYLKSLNKPRRIAINADILDVLSRNPKRWNDIRSLLMFSPPKHGMKEKAFSCIQNSSKLVKVLEVGSLFATRLPDQVWSFVLLKYFAISGNITSIPSTLSDLLSLQTLIVDTTSPTLEIKADIWHMPHFRHLHTNASATFPCKSTEDGGSNFRTMCYISPECCKRQVFHQTTKLRKLGIRGTLANPFEANSEASLLEYLHNLAYLENLKLVNWNISPSPHAKISFPQQLTKLTLSHTRLHWKEMRTIGEMEKLEILKLKDYAFVGEKWKTENGGFLHLKHLHIGHMDLTTWEAEADHFPQLGRLEISECDRLLRIPLELADISSLQSVHLHRSTSHGVTYSLKRIRLVKFLQAKPTDKRKVFEISVFPPQE